MAQRVVLGVAVMVLAAAAGSAGRAQALANPGFEPPYAAVSSGAAAVSGEVAHGWEDLSYGPVTATYAEETTGAHGGKACQRVTVGAVGSGGGYQFGQQVVVPAGDMATPGLWFKGTAGARLDLLLIQPVSPWKWYGDAPLYLTGSWQFVAYPLYREDAGAADDYGERAGELLPG